MCGRQQIAGATVECSELSVHIRGTIIPRYGKNAASVLLIIASTMASTGPCTLEGEARGMSCSSQACGHASSQASTHRKSCVSRQPWRRRPPSPALEPPPVLAPARRSFAMGRVVLCMARARRTASHS